MTVRRSCMSALLTRTLCWTSVAIAAVALPGSAQIRDTPNESPGVANIPVNYTEALAGTHPLPPILSMSDGRAVTTPEQWREQRRPEIFKLIEENMFGRSPGRPDQLHVDVFDKGTPALDGKAIRKQVTIFFTDRRDEQYVDVLIYLPANAPGPVPLLLTIGWSPNGTVISDPGVKPGRQWDRRETKRVPADTSRPGFGRLNAALAIERGYGIATFNYNDVEPDALDALSHGVRALYLKPGQAGPADDEWGAIAAWGWAVSRMVDYLETDPDVDAKKIAITGASRLGKTVLWAGARDERIACVIASVSGEGGAAISRRDYGEKISHLVAPTRFPYWYAKNLQSWADRMHEAPWDSHMLLALIAPRPLLLHTGSADKFSDPYGEWIAAREASPVYELLGAQGVTQYAMPDEETLMPTTLGWYMHKGGHGVPASVWPVFYDYLDIHFKGVAPPTTQPATSPTTRPN